MTDELLTTKDLTERWKLKDNTLRTWRMQGKGPAYIRLGESTSSQIRYRLSDIEKYEKENTINE